MTISINQRNDGQTGITTIMTEKLADDIISNLESDDKAMHYEVLKYLYRRGYLEARVRKLYTCNLDGTYKEGGGE